MKVLIAGGGTAGHINPALAIAAYIRKQQPEAEILFVGTPHGMESRLVPQAGFDFAPMNVAGFQRQLNWFNIKNNVKAVWYLLSAGARAKKIVEQFKPDVAIGTGGYVSGPIMRKAAQMGVPLVIHEQNAFPGVTTKLLSKSAKCVMLAVEDAKKFLDESVEYKVVGNPVRAEILSADKGAARRELGIDEKPLVLSFGGSLGARAVNEAMIPMLERSANDKKYNHIHGYGRYGSFVPETLAQDGVDLEKCPNLDLREYINNMATVMAAADLVICRSGAITLTELQAMGKPAILIPSPNVAENHQYHNAMALVRRGAAAIIEEKDLTPEKLMKTADKLLTNKKALTKMASASKRMALNDACERIYEYIVKLI